MVDLTGCTQRQFYNTSLHILNPGEWRERTRRLTGHGCSEGGFASPVAGECVKGEDRRSGSIREASMLRHLCHLRRTLPGGLVHFVPARLGSISSADTMEEVGTGKSGVGISYRVSCQSWLWITRSLSLRCGMSGLLTPQFELNGSDKANHAIRHPVRVVLQDVALGLV